jgi:ATP-binding cassette subfamily B protein
MSARAASLTGVLHDREIEVSQRPLDLRILVRMFRFAAPHERHRNKLLLVVLARSAQLPILDKVLGLVVSAIIAKSNADMLPWGVAALLGWALLTQFTMHFRMRWAMEYGELVVGDLRNAIFSHLQTLSMGYFQRNRIGRNISRVTSDAEAVRSGIQDVLFMSLVNIGQIIIASILLIWLDPVLYLVLLVMTPLLLAFNVFYKRYISRVLRQVQESFSRVTSTVAESVNGIRVTQGFARQDVNAELFHDLISDHAVYNVHKDQAQSVYGPVLDFNNQFFVATLLLIGDHEIMYEPRKAIQHAMELIPNLQAELIRDAGHMLNGDQPEIVNRRILKFLSPEADEITVQA